MKIYMHSIAAIVALVTAEAKDSDRSFIRSTNKKDAVPRIEDSAFWNRQLSASSNGDSNPPSCDPCERSSECWLDVPDTVPDAVDPTGYQPIARADVILKNNGPISHQIYKCVNNDDVYEWKLVDVEAFLYNEDEDMVGFHFFRSLNAGATDGVADDSAGKPRWQVEDSVITGSLLSKVASPDKGDNIAWLWVDIIENNEFAPLGGATRIGRYCTKGGTTVDAPTCSPESEGEVYRSPYETSYYYFAKK